eukprot:354778-Chlamydomonas_euryale.AAC.5
MHKIPPAEHLEAANGSGHSPPPGPTGVGPSHIPPPALGAGARRHQRRVWRRRKWRAVRMAPPRHLGAEPLAVLAAWPRPPPAAHGLPDT